MAKLVSKVYGEALFEAAVDHGNAIQLMNETAQLEKILEDNPDFDKLMKHPGIPKQEKLSMVEQVFRGRVSDDLTEFLKIVVTKERYGSLKAIFAYFTELVRESEKMGTAYVDTAVELTEAQKQDEISLHMMGYIKSCTNEIIIEVLAEILGLEDSQ